MDELIALFKGATCVWETEDGKRQSFRCGPGTGFIDIKKSIFKAY
jgi:hypothetical protein